MDRRDRTAVVYTCGNRGEDFALTEQDEPADSLDVTCPDCGSGLVAVDFAAVRRGATDRRRRGSAVRGTDGESRTGEARRRA
jgi:transcription initiation factor IIE alpha subunit